VEVDTVFTFTLTILFIASLRENRSDYQSEENLKWKKKIHHNWVIMLLTRKEMGLKKYSLNQLFSKPKIWN